MLLRTQIARKDPLQRLSMFRVFLSDLLLLDRVFFSANINAKSFSTQLDEIIVILSQRGRL